MSNKKKPFYKLVLIFTVAFSLVGFAGPGFVAPGKAPKPRFTEETMRKTVSEIITTHGKDFFEPEVIKSLVGKGNGRYADREEMKGDFDLLESLRNKDDAESKARYEAVSKRIHEKVGIEVFRGIDNGKLVFAPGRGLRATESLPPSEQEAARQKTEARMTTYEEYFGKKSKVEEVIADAQGAVTQVKLASKAKAEELSAAGRKTGEAKTVSENAEKLAGKEVAEIETLLKARSNQTPVVVATKLALEALQNHAIGSIGKDGKRRPGLTAEEQMSALKLIKYWLRNGEASEISEAFAKLETYLAYAEPTVRSKALKNMVKVEEAFERHVKDLLKEHKGTKEEGTTAERMSLLSDKDRERVAREAAKRVAKEMGKESSPELISALLCRCWKKVACPTKGGTASARRKGGNFHDEENSLQRSRIEEATM